MKKKMVIQMFLAILALSLFFFTYYYKNPQHQLDSNLNTDTVTDTDKIDSTIKSTHKTSSIIENAKYTGSNNRGSFFEINANLAEVTNVEPNLSYMKKVKAVIKLIDGRAILIESDRAIYNRLTNDTNFMENVLITDEENKIACDNLDLYISKNLITAYNNVKYDSLNGFLLADKVDIDILKKEAKIFMFDPKNNVKLRYKN